MSAKALIHIVDDDEAVRESLAFLFESDGFLVRSHGSGAEALEAITGGEATCVVTDVRMPGMNGVELLRTLRARDLGLPVIVITGHGDVPLAVEAMKAGAADFLEKPFSDDALLASVRRAIADLDADAAAPELKERLASLSRRERQVLAGLVQGQLNKIVAAELGISMRTVEVYRAKLMAKMQAASFAELVRMAVRAGFDA